MIENIQILISGLVCGVILFQTAIIAPSVFKILKPENAGPFLRSIFPKLFMFVAFLSSAGLILSLISGTDISIYVYAFSLIFMSICYYIVPMTNKARDSGDDKTFRNLHTISVVLTMLVLISNLGWMFFLK
tara:strand:+ start:345 stop:737 length:393 start_codon:yes stop_codon:yes gene_type:complete